MASNSPFLRPLAIAAGGLGSVQAITWSILSLLGILLYAREIELQPHSSVGNLFINALDYMYFDYRGTSLTNMSSGTVVYWTATYFGISVIWLVISGFLLHESYNYRFRSKVLIGWVTVSGVIAVIDFAGAVAFGVDYYRVKGELDIVFHSTNFGVEYLLAPVFMMVMCARGFILWIINVGLVIYLGVAERKLFYEVSTNLSQDPEYSSHHQGRQKTVREVMNPVPPIPRAGKPLPTTVFPLTAHNTDNPSQMQHQKHEPNMNERRPQSVQLHANSQRQSYF